MDPSISSDTEDEVFFGPILAKEAKKASKLRRATQVFLPNFRQNRDTSSSSGSSRCEREDTDSSLRCELEDTGSSRCEPEDTDSLSDEVFEAAEADHVREALSLERLNNPSQTERVTKAENVPKQALGSLPSPQQILKELKSEAGPRCSTPGSPFPKIAELTKNKSNNDSEQEDSPFQRKSKALLGLIHRAREEWSSPTHSPMSPSSVSLSESSSTSTTKRKHDISTIVDDPSSPIFKKVTKVSSGSEALQTKEGEACRSGTNGNQETDHTKSPSPAEVTDRENVSRCLNSSPNAVQKSEHASQPKEGCLKNLCQDFAEVERSVRSDDTRQIKSEVQEEESKSGNQNSQCLDLSINTSNEMSAEKQTSTDLNLGQIKDGLSSSWQTEECEEDASQPTTKASTFRRVKLEPSMSDSSLHTSFKSPTNYVSCRGGHTPFRDAGSQSKQPNLQNKENLVNESEQPYFEKVFHDGRDTPAKSTTEEKNDDIMNIQKKGMSTPAQAFHDCSNLIVGYQRSHGNQLISSPFNSSLTTLSDTSDNPQHTMENMNMHDYSSPMSSNCSQVAVITQETNPRQVDSPMSLRRKLLEQKRDQLMRLKQAKDEMKHQIIQEKQVETSFDELTRFYTWKNSQLLSEKNYPLGSPECLHSNPDKPRLRWTDSLVVEVAELSSPSRPARKKGKSILSKRL